MKIVPNIDEIYRLMSLHDFETVRELSKASGIECGTLYGVFDRGVTL